MGFLKYRNFIYYTFLESAHFLHFQYSLTHIS